MSNKLPVLFAVMQILTGCSSILSGHDQKITITTTPAGAQCDLMRNGERINQLASTPGEVTIEKTKDDIKLICRKDGYLDTEAVLDSGVDSAAYANIFLGGTGLITWGVDSIVGADNKYPESPSLTLGSAPSTTKTVVASESLNKK